MRTIKLVLVFLLGSFALGSSFDEFFEETVMPFYESAPEGTLQRSGGVNLSYKIFEHPLERGAIVFVTGWTETHLKYAELLWELYQAGYSVYSVDNRGMGFSTRLTANAQQVHVEKVQDYVDDLKEFVEKVVRPEKHEKSFFIAHSMGGLITAKYLAQNPGVAHAAVFSAPLFQLNTGKIPERVAFQITRREIKKGNGKKYALTQGDTTYEKAADFNTQKTTHSLKRWNRKTANWKQFPILLQGGSTNQWVNTILENTFGLLEGGWKKMPVPSLILEASNDSYVINRGHEKVCSQAEHCFIKRFEGTYHELFLECDKFRDQVLRETFAFLEQY
ncbi:MAG: alpha/beta fold hydrolase [Pseudomonadota bacterium]